MRCITVTAMAALAALELCGCGGEASLEPPVIHYGESICDVCGMIISDERFAAAIVWADDGGRHELLLDDAGELADVKRVASDREVVYVHDALSADWIDARAAVFLRSEDLHTPMGTGVAAYADRASAEAAQQARGGELLALDDVRPD